MADSTDRTEPYSVQHKPLQFDWREHLDLLDDQELSEDEQREFLETLWTIMVHFVDMGFEVNPLQILFEQIEETATSDGCNVVDCNHTSPRQLKQSTDDQNLSDLSAKEDS